MSKLHADKPWLGGNNLHYINRTYAHLYGDNILFDYLPAIQPQIEYGLFQMLDIN